MLVFIRCQHDTFACRFRRYEFLFFAVSVERDQTVGDREDVRRAAEILLELDNRRVGPIALESHYVADVGAAPAVDRLVRIARSADIAVLRNQQLGDLVLGVIGILIFVDQHKLKAVAKLAADIGTISEQDGRLHQQVIEIDAVSLAQQVLIALIYIGQCPRKKIVGLFRERFGISQLVLESGNRVEHPSGWKIRSIQVAILDRLLDTPQLVRLVVDAEVRVHCRSVGIPSKNPHTQRVKSADMRAGGGSERQSPLAHLLSSFVGKGYRADIVRADTRINQCRNPMYYYACLATARAGEDKQRTFDMKDRFSL